MKRIKAVARKEIFHILRDPRSLGVAVFMPLGMLLLYGTALNTELRNLPVAFLDDDHTVESRALIRQMTSSDFIVDAARLGSRDEIEPGFRRGRFRAAVVIPPHYAEQLATAPVSEVQVLVDGADGSTAATTDNYIRAVLAQVAADVQNIPRGAAGGPVDARVRILFNPELKSAAFIVPGLVAVVLMMICALLTSIAITREKETGTLEQILTTPVNGIEIIVGKVIPYSVIGAADTALVLTAGYVVFHVPMVGSWWVLAGYSLVFILIALSLGIMVSAIASTQRVAMTMALLMTFLPTLLLSGFVFDHSSMPPALRGIAQLVPATHFLQIVHGVMLKGQAWFPRQLLVLVVMLVFLLGVSTRRFRTVLG